MDAGARMLQSGTEEWAASVGADEPDTTRQPGLVEAAEAVLSLPDIETALERADRLDKYAMYEVAYRDLRSALSAESERREVVREMVAELEEIRRGWQAIRDTHLQSPSKWPALNPWQEERLEYVDAVLRRVREMR